MSEHAETIRRGITSSIKQSPRMQQAATEARQALDALVARVDALEAERDEARSLVEQLRRQADE